MGEKKRSYLNPEFEYEFTLKAAEWNWDLAKRKVKRIINQHKADKEYAADNPKKKKEPGLGMGRTRALLEQVDD